MALKQLQKPIVNVIVFQQIRSQQAGSVGDVGRAGSRHGRHQGEEGGGERRQLLRGPPHHVGRDRAERKRRGEGSNSVTLFK